STRRPAATSSAVATRPASPAPTTMTSASNTDLLRVGGCPAPGPRGGPRLGSQSDVGWGSLWSGAGHPPAEGARRPVAAHCAGGAGPGGHRLPRRGDHDDPVADHA